MLLAFRDLKLFLWLLILLAYICNLNINSVIPLKEYGFLLDVKLIEVSRPF